MEVDATVLSQRVSGTVVVVREGVTHHRDMQDTLGKLEFANAKVLAFILHDVKKGKVVGAVNTANIANTVTMLIKMMPIHSMDSKK